MTFLHSIFIIENTKKHESSGTPRRALSGISEGEAEHQCHASPSHSSTGTTGVDLSRWPLAWLARMDTLLT